LRMYLYDCNMTRFRYFISGLLFVLIASACNEDIRIPNFEPQKWKEDPNGCNGDREKLLTILLTGRSQVIGKNEVEVKEFLGKPDSQDLRTRGQKFFEYGVKGGNLCNPQSLNQPEILRIRFDALDRVTEMAVY